MPQDKLAESKESGAHGRLASLVGEWEGTTKTWFEPGKLGAESPSKGTIEPFWTEDLSCMNTRAA